jgi:hypothetical protein
MVYIKEVYYNMLLVLAIMALYFFASFKHFIVDRTQNQFHIAHAEDISFQKVLFRRLNSNCTDKVCSEFLNGPDMLRFKHCVSVTWKLSVEEYNEPNNSVCVFVKESHRYPLSLASYPGSGNTWVRGLLQKVTGLCTGAIYCDGELRQNGFPGENIRNGVTLVKTHQSDPKWEWIEYSNKKMTASAYSGGVFILRNPFHAIVAEFQRKTHTNQPGSHVKTLGKDYFGECMHCAIATQGCAPQIWD